MSGWLSEMLAGFQRERFSWTKKVSFRSLAGSLFQAFLALLRNGAAYAVLIVMVLNSKISTGDFVFYFGAITGFSVWLNGIADRLNDIAQKSVKIGYYRDYLEIKEQYNYGPGCPLPSEKEMPPDIEFCNVSYKYASAGKETYALKNISLKIHRGEKIAVVGLNGAGKTTLVKLMCGLYRPTDGGVRLNNHAVSEYNIEEYYSLFSAVFQDIYLLPVSIAVFTRTGSSLLF